MLPVVSKVSRRETDNAGIGIEMEVGKEEEEEEEEMSWLRSGA